VRNAGRVSICRIVFSRCDAMAQRLAPGPFKTGITPQSMGHSLRINDLGAYWNGLKRNETMDLGAIRVQFTPGWHIRQPNCLRRISVRRSDLPVSLSFHWATKTHPVAALKKNRVFHHVCFAPDDDPALVSSGVERFYRENRSGMRVQTA
jgi:hypothetical protein